MKITQAELWDHPYDKVTGTQYEISFGTDELQCMINRLTELLKLNKNDSKQCKLGF